MYGGLARIYTLASSAYLTTKKM